MPRNALRRSVTLRIGRIPQDVSRPELIRMLTERFGTWKLLAVQFLPGMRVQLTFDSVEAKTSIERQSQVEIEGYPCQVVGGGPSLESVMVFHLPYDLDNELIQTALQGYGEVGGVRHQLHPDSEVHSGTRIVRMVRKGPIPRHIKVDGFSGKVWYRGQPVECDICGAGHVSRVCPMRNKCRFCGEEGHFARNCPGRNGEGWGEVAAPSTSDAPVTGQGGGSDDLRDNQLDELSSQVAPAPASASAVGSGPDSLEGAMVASVVSSGASQSVLAGLVPNSNLPDAPNSDSANSNPVDAPNSDSVNLVNVCNVPLDNEMEVLDSSGNASGISKSDIVNKSSNVNNVSNNESNASIVAISKDNGKSVNNVSSDNGVAIKDNGKSESNASIVAISKDNGKSVNVSSDNGVAINKDNGKSGSNVSGMVIESSDISDSESEDGEIRSDASIGGPSGDESSLDSVRSTDREGFAVPLPPRRSARKPPVVVSPGRQRSVSPIDSRSRSPHAAGKHSLPPAVPSRPKSRRS